MPKLFHDCPNCPNEENGTEIYQCENEECEMIFCVACTGHHGPIEDGDFYCPYCSSENLTRVGEIQKPKET